MLWSWSTVESQYYEPLYNEVLGLTKIFFPPVILKCTKKNHNITKPHYSKHILPAPWPFLKSVFHSIASQSSVFLGQFCGPAFVYGDDIFKLWGKWCFIKLNNILALCYNVLQLTSTLSAPTVTSVKFLPTIPLPDQNVQVNQNELNDEHWLNVLMFEQILL